MNIYNIEVLKPGGTKQSLSEFKGKVMLVVNTATHCGFTPQYEDLKNLHNKYYDQGLEILDFPCNQFGQQAQGSDEEIASFCQLNYNTPYRQYAKINVNGEDQTELYQYLKSQKSFEGFNNPEHKLNSVLGNMMKEADPNYEKNPDIKWNFTKFLIDREGNVIARFEPVASTEEIEALIQSLL